ncbi:MAG TPA: hypothetical protein DDW50_09770 [Firmicutes bacterium]|nr:hypothetical protein [Bacillota bacterium]
MGDFLGEMALVDGLPRNVSAMAEPDATVIGINKDNFQNAICDPTSIPYRIIVGLVHQMNQLHHEIARLGNSEGTSEGTLSESNATEVTDSEAEPIMAGQEQSDNPSPVSEDAGTNPVISGVGNLFPEGHKKYNQVAASSYNDYLISSHSTCPVCGNIFEAKKLYQSKMKFQMMDHDFRKHYADFEPTWYSIWVCPKCYYANFYTDYNEIPPYKKQVIIAKMDELKKQFSFQFSEPRTIDQVFEAFYLAMVCAELAHASSLKIGKIWLQLSWLYHDVQDEEMFRIASAQALKGYYDVVYKTGEKLSVGQAQQCFLLLGELYLLQGNEKEALRHFYTAIKKEDGREAFNQQAEDRIHDIRIEKMNF